VLSHLNFSYQQHLFLGPNWIKIKLNKLFLKNG
jgi:hypothetical protein